MKQVFIGFFLFLATLLGASTQLKAEAGLHHACSVAHNSNVTTGISFPATQSLASGYSLSPLSAEHINMGLAPIETTEDEVSLREKWLKVNDFYTLILCAFAVTGFCAYIRQGLAYYKNFSNFISYSRFIILRVIRL